MQALLVKIKDNINLPLEKLYHFITVHMKILLFYIRTKIDIAIFNLGYYQVGDHKFTTRRYKAFKDLAR